MKTPTPGLHAIIYVSESLIPESDVAAVLDQIVTAAKKRNCELEVTGALLYHQGKFLQILEGDGRSLYTLLEKIRQDPRHRNLQIIVDEAIEMRGFSSWNMDSFILARGQIDPDRLRELKDAYLMNFRLDPLSLLDVFQTLT
ncbi:MAG: hypothetical protein RL095_2595 [Verrucomicrobiota bacterium]|jgi:hypothetical protein